jgi:hypothetical protein
MAKKGRKRTPPAGQGTLFGPDDVCGGAAPAIPAPEPREPHPPGDTPVPPRWDEGLCPPTPQELAALRAAHPGAMLLFRHPGGCAFHGDDATEAVRLLGLFPAARGMSAWAGWPHGDFEKHMRRLLRAGKTVAVVERGEGLPPGHRLGACPVVTPFTEVGEEDAPGA